MIRAKASLSLVIALVALVLCGLAGFYAYYHYSNQVNRQLEVSSTHLRQVLSLASARIESDVGKQNEHGVEREILNLKQFSEVELSALIGADGMVRYSSSYIVWNLPAFAHLPMLDQATFIRAQAARQPVLMTNPQHDVLHAYFPVVMHRSAGPSAVEETGVLFVEWDIKPRIDQLRHSAIADMLAMWLMVLLTLTLIWFVLYQQLLQPLAKLRKKVVAASRGREPVKFESNGDASLVALADSLNKMVSRQNKSLADSQRDKQRWQFALESGGDCVLDWNITNGECFFSPGFGALLGLAADQKPDLTIWKEKIDEDWDFVDRKIKRHLQGLSDLCQVEYAIRLPGGRKRFIIMRGKVVERNAQGDALRMVSTHRDITPRRRMEDALRGSEERYRKLFEMAQEGIWQIDREGKTILVNESMATILGYHSQELLDCPIVDFMAETSRVHALEKLSRKGQGADSRQEYEFVSKAGLRIFTTMHWTPIYDLEGDFNGMIAGVMDISERKRAEERIRQQALFDDLTKLPNRRMLNETLTQEQARALRHGHTGALLFIDLDHFKNVNDSLGHPVGDSLLITIASRLNQVLRSEDTLARLGGDEFVVLLPELNDDAAQAATLARNVALKIQDSLSETLEVYGHRLNIGCSIGIALYPLDQDSIHDIVKQADAAMYRAKEDGRNAVCLFSKDMHQKIEDNLRLQMLLPGAMEDEQFMLYFQPQFDQHRNLIGAEVLLRWEEPQQGFVSPDLFIRAAEESGQIVPLGDWVLRKACAQLSKWRQQGLPTSFERLAINISARQFSLDDFPFRVKAFVEEAGLQPADIELEITESMLLNKRDQVIEKMHLLHDMGFHIALDDFGTGYSSLSYLHTLPLDKLKIDQAFIRDVGEDKADRAIVETIITMANLMELDVIAEGVEEEYQLKYLISKGCIKYQGYYFAKPMPADVFASSYIYDAAESRSAK
ncbi:MAG: EAL domain-containing protein [Ketobacter sp.]